jgi:hypothetical protein
MGRVMSPSPSTSSLFLRIAGGVFLVSYALPLLLAPLAWARVLRWRIPSEADLTVYFGRCVGGVATSVCLACFVAATDPAGNRLLFDLIAAIGVAMVGVHAWGAVRRTQPWTETAEIPLYLGLAALALHFRP